jgi:hypothetical protein
MSIEPLNFDVESFIAARIGAKIRPSDRAQVYHPATTLARLNVRGPGGHGAALAGEAQESIVVDVAHRIASDADLDGFHSSLP